MLILGISRIISGCSIVHVFMSNIFLSELVDLSELNATLFGHYIRILSLVCTWSILDIAQDHLYLDNLGYVLTIISNLLLLFLGVTSSSSLLLILVIQWRPPRRFIDKPPWRSLSLIYWRLLALIDRRACLHINFLLISFSSSINVKLCIDIRQFTIDNFNSIRLWSGATSSAHFLPSLPCNFYSELGWGSYCNLYNVLGGHVDRRLLLLLRLWLEKVSF